MSDTYKISVCLSWKIELPYFDLTKGVHDGGISGITWITTWTVFTLLLLLWTSLLFTLPRTSWPCPTSRHVNCTHDSFIHCPKTLVNETGHTQYFSLFFTGSSHSWYLGRQRSRKILPMRACLCQDGNQVSKCCIYITTTKQNTSVIYITTLATLLH